MQETTDFPWPKEHAFSGQIPFVFVAETVPEAFADRLRRKGTEVVRAGATYEASMAEAERQAAENGWQLLSDSTWPEMTSPGRDVMEGYLIMGEEIKHQIPEPPTHVFLQAGVGGLAAACASSARTNWGKEVTIIVVEPEAAPALQASIAAGKPVVAPGPVSNMGRLDCKEPSHLAVEVPGSTGKPICNNLGQGSRGDSSLAGNSRS